jgi:hypothetical protein
MTNRSKTFYLGVTGSLERRGYEHKTQTDPRLYIPLQYHKTGMLRRNRQRQPGHCRGITDQRLAAGEENHHIESINPNWDDLSTEWNS